MRIRLWIVLLPFVLLLGCGGGASGGANSAVPASPSQTEAQNLAGNWSFQATSSMPAGAMTQLGGYLSTATITGQSGATLAGNLFVFASSSSCFPLLTDVPVTGTVDENGNLQITSAPVARQVISVTGSVDPSGASLRNATYSITSQSASQPGCASGDAGAIVGTKIQPVSGTYTGAITSATGETVQATAQLSQTLNAATPSLFMLSGSIQSSNSPCFQDATFAAADSGFHPGLPASSMVTGTWLAGYLTTGTGAAQSQILVEGQIDATASKMNLIYAISGGACDGDSGSGTLSLQG